MTGAFVCIVCDNDEEMNDKIKISGLTPLKYTMEAIQKSVSKLEKHEQNYNFEHGKEKESKTSASRGLNT